MQPLVSVIVPIYNAEKYLKECINSLISQSEKNIEIILVNDGSTDNSLNIAYEYANKDPRIKVLNQENAGPSEARNNGIDHSCGNYLSFIDADDWIEQNMYKEMLACAMNKEVDLVLSNMKLINKDNQIVHAPIKEINKSIFNKSEILNELVPFALEFGNINSLASNLYCRELVDSNNIRLNVDIFYGEDWIFNLEYLKHSKCALYMDKSFYNYRRGIDSSSSKYNDKTFETNGVIIYRTSQDYANYFKSNIYIGGANFLNVTIHCIICECRRHDIGFRDKLSRIMSMLNNPKLNEAVKNTNLKKLPYKNKVMAMLLKYRLNWLVCGYFGIKNFLM
ncbi:glycosyltransferase [Rossellomorea sp. GAMAL-10_SWC]